MADPVAWKEFKTRFAKEYETAEEEQQRYAVFKSNLKLAAEYDAADAKASYGVTKFMDLSPEEFRQYYLMPKEIYANFTVDSTRVAPREATPVNAPASYDWRQHGAITPVYNQGQCGSCWAFSATETIESYNFLCGNGLNSESMQQIVSCDTTAYGCNGGWTYAAYEYVKSAGGIEPFSDYPYTAQTGTCQFDASKINEHISGWSYVTQSADESAMQNWMLNKGPLSVCVDASQWQYYTGGVVTNCGTQIDHCVQATGYSTQQGTAAWNVRNSWGTDWGNSGYLYVERGSDTCAIGQVVTAVSCS
jgi:cathepsin F